MFEIVRQDYRRYGPGRGNLLTFAGRAAARAGFRAVVLYRVGAWCRGHHLGWVGGLCERLIRHLCLCSISTAATIGPGFKISHCLGLVIGSGTVIGGHCDVRQNTTFGGNFSKTDAAGRTKPTLGDHISVGAGAVIAGPVKVGSHSIIGANAVVTADVPANVIAAGIPARVIKARWNSSEQRGL